MPTRLNQIAPGVFPAYQGRNRLYAYAQTIEDLDHLLRTEPLAVALVLGVGMAEVKGMEPHIQPLLDPEYVAKRDRGESHQLFSLPVQNWERIKK
jgi:hypothetical protein